MYPELMQ
jgi:CLIP-associating protein 1/2